MLQLKNIKKDYVTSASTVSALKGVSLEFRTNEFVSILGPSGCGKTTLLNIIGGLDHYTSGDLVISGISTKNYADRDWDAYRNHRIGFVFQSYNLIPHQTVLGNVELSLTIAGVSKEERRRRAEEALIRVGLEKEMKKRPNQLSGGQMQRVAIARALVNNPEILLADEPTGALDSVTSVQIMELIREIAGERLVIMVTHNPELAEQYSTRIVKLQDGRVVSDSNPFDSSVEEDKVVVKSETIIEKGSKEKTEDIKQANAKPKKQKKMKTSMSFKTALGLSGRNLYAKKGRTFVTSFAGSIGIISVCLVLALSNGFNNYILKTEEDMLSYNPVEIEETTMDVSAIMSGMTSLDEMPELDKIGDKVYVHSFLTNIAQGMQVTNNLSEEYISYLGNMPLEYYSAIQYDYGTTIVDNLFTSATLNSETEGGTVEKIFSLSKLKEEYTAKLNQLDTEENKQYAQLAPLVNYLGAVVNKMPGTSDFNDARFSEYVKSQYDIIEGDFPKASNEAVLVIGENNDVTDLTLVQLGLLTEKQFFDNLYENESGDFEHHYVDFSTIMNKKYTLFFNDAVYTKDPNWTMQSRGYAFTYSGEKDSLAVSSESGTPNGIEIKISGVLRLKEGRTYGCLSSGLNLTEKLVKEYLSANLQSEISQWVNNPEYKSKLNMTAQKLSSYAIQAMATGGDFTAMKRAIGASDVVSKISLYTESFETKQAMLSYLDDWNDQKEEEFEVKYTDRVGMMMSMVEIMLNAITYVLVAFTAISLVVSSVMIGIITYVSVVERTKEIGVLRAIGARKLDIKNLFNAETFIIGLASGAIGAGVAYLLCGIVNLILGSLTGISTLASLKLTSALIMVLVSITLTLISGLIPAQAAAKKDPVVALRTE